MPIDLPEETEVQSSLECLRRVTLSAFAALDSGEGLRVENDDIDGFVNDAVAEMRVMRRISSAYSRLPSS